MSARPAHLVLTAAGTGLLLGLAACQPEQPSEEPEEKAEPAPEPTPSDPRRFIGRWARSADQCETDWWRFWADELRTKTEGMHCDILPPDASFSDTELRTVCRMPDGGFRETWTLSYGDDAQTMTIRGEEGQEVELVKCE